jgi:hypothetical protein
MINHSPIWVTYEWADEPNIRLFPLRLLVAVAHPTHIRTKFKNDLRYRPCRGKSERMHFLNYRPYISGKHSSAISDPQSRTPLPLRPPPARDRTLPGVSMVFNPNYEQGMVTAADRDQSLGRSRPEHFSSGGSSRGETETIEAMISATRSHRTTDVQRPPRAWCFGATCWKFSMPSSQEPMLRCGRSGRIIEIPVRRHPYRYRHTRGIRGCGHL